jgi:hypothetical protein
MRRQFNKNLANQGQVCYLLQIFQREERMRYALVIMIAALLLAAAQARAEFYRWTDRDGREFYTNEKEKVPAEYRGSARPVEVHEERVNVGEKPGAGGTRTVKAPEHKDKNGKGEEYWRKRAEKLRRQLRSQQDDFDMVQKQLEAAEKPKTVGASSDSSRSASTASLRKKKSQLEKKIGRTKHELEIDLPEEARKADAYPGWLRE